MKQLVLSLLIIATVSANAQCTDSIKNKNYQYSYVEFSQNPHAMTVHTKFNIQNYDTLHTIVEAIDGVERMDTWGVDKYDFLVITGDMFDPYQVAATIQKKIEYILAPRIDSMLYYRQMVVYYTAIANFYQNQFKHGSTHDIEMNMKMYNYNIDLSNKHLYYKGKNVLSEFPDYPLTPKEKKILGL